MLLYINYASVKLLLKKKKKKKDLKVKTMNSSTRIVGYIKFILAFKTWQITSQFTSFFSASTDWASNLLCEGGT